MFGSKFNFLNYIQIREIKTQNDQIKVVLDVHIIRYRQHQIQVVLDIGSARYRQHKMYIAQDIGSGRYRKCQIQVAKDVRSARYWQPNICSARKGSTRCTQRQIQVVPDIGSARYRQNKCRPRYRQYMIQIALDIWDDTQRKEREGQREKRKLMLSCQFTAADPFSSC